MANTIVVTITLSTLLGAASAVGDELTLEQVITPPAKVEARLHGVTNVVFIEMRELPDTNQWHFNIKESETLKRLLSTIKLKPKAMCQCAHRYEAIFEGSSDAVHVSFCDHCFDVKGDHFGTYMMPKAFYEEFHDLAHKHNWSEPPGWP